MIEPPKNKVFVLVQVVTFNFFKLFLVIVFSGSSHSDVIFDSFMYSSFIEVS